METPRIVINPAIMVGKPIIEGTRLTVQFVLEHLSQGMSEKEMLEYYPTLTLGGIRAALAYAADSLQAVQTYPLHFVS